MLEEREKGQGYRDKNDTAQVREVGRGSGKCRALTSRIGNLCEYSGK